MKPILIGLHGPTGVGKDTIAKIGLRIAYAHRLAFGDALKQTCKAAFGLTEEWLQDDHKTIKHPFWNITPREMFQAVGQLFRANFGDDYWVKRLQPDYDRLCVDWPTHPIIVTDVRFNGANTEANWVRANGGVIVHVRGPQRRPDVNAQHVSNTEIAVQKDDLTLINDGSLSRLQERVRILIESLQ